MGLSAVRFVEGDARRFGEFELIAKLGRGGMAEVFLASKIERPTELVVIKRLVADLGDDEHRALFADETRVMSMLRHPNIVRTLDSSLARGAEFLAMEFLDGLALDRCAGVVTGLGERAALHVVSELLDGLHYAHELRTTDGASAELVHRDVSPHNVFLTYEGRVTLVDFGIAKSRTRAQHTATGVVRGKLTYMAPEQALCDEVDRRADVFAAGVILWELLTGERFWASSSDVQILKRMTFGEIPDAVHPKIRAELGEVLSRALAAKPEARFPTARAFREALAPLASGAFKRTELGARVSDAAGAYKGALEAAIAAHLAAARGAGGLPGIDDAPPLIEPPPAPPSLRGKMAATEGSVAAASGPGAALSESAAAAAAPTPEASSAEEESQPSGPRRRREIGLLDAPGDATPDPLALTRGNSALSVGPEARRRRGGVGLVGGAGVALAVLVAIFGVLRARTAATTEASAAVTAPVDVAAPLPLQPAPSAAAAGGDAAVPASAAASDVIEVKLDAVPRDAVVTLDGNRVTDLPLAARFPRDRMGHELVVRAGTRSESRILVFDRDVDVTVDLKSPASASTPVKSFGARPPATASAKLVDDSDPWAHRPKKN